MRGLGELEAAVMDVLWTSEQPLPVRAVLEALTRRKPLAYTTVMTVLDNLHRKGYVQRAKSGRAFMYEPSVSRGQAAADAIRQILDETVDTETALLLLARSVSEPESRALRHGLDRRRRRP